MTDHRPEQDVPPPSVKDTRPAVVIDPGHGGEETGAIGWHTGVPEKQITLAIAGYCRDYLRQQNIRVIMTRSSDRMMNAESKDHDLHDRAQLADKVEADLFVSIHADQYDETVHGSKVFYSEINPYTDQSQELAGYVFDELIGELGSRPLGVFMEDFIVLRENSVPAILVETGFVSHREEEQKLITPSYQKKAGMAIAKGIMAYLKHEGLLKPESEKSKDVH